MGKYVSKPPSGPDGVYLAPDGDGSQFAAAYPALWEYLTEQYFEDGVQRRTSTIKVFLGDYGLQALLEDREAERIAFVTGGTVEDLLEALETGLRKSSLDWRLSYAAKHKKGRK